AGGVGSLDFGSIRVVALSQDPEPSGNRRSLAMVSTGNGNHGSLSEPPALADDLGLHYPGFRDPYSTGAFGVERAAATLRRFEFVHRKLVFLEAAHVVLRSLWELKAALGR